LRDEKIWHPSAGSNSKTSVALPLTGYRISKDWIGLGKRRELQCWNCSVTYRDE
jgi:hypothetical protein